MNSSTEIWKDVEGFEGLYQVSNHGNIKSLARTTLRKDGYVANFSEKILYPGIDSSGYKITALRKDKKANSKSVHRLVASTFVPNPQNKKCVNHKDENKLNNHVDNLEWCTYKENNTQSTMDGRGKNKGQYGGKRLNSFQVRVIKKTTDLSYRQLSEIFNIGRLAISDIKNNKTWKYIK